MKIMNILRNILGIILILIGLFFELALLAAGFHHPSEIFAVILFIFLPIGLGLLISKSRKTLAQIFGFFAAFVFLFFLIFTVLIPAFLEPTVLSVTCNSGKILELQAIDPPFTWENDSRMPILSYDGKRIAYLTRNSVIRNAFPLNPETRSNFQYREYAKKSEDYGWNVFLDPEKVKYEEYLQITDCYEKNQGQFDEAFKQTTWRALFNSEEKVEFEVGKIWRIAYVNYEKANASTVYICQNAEIPQIQITFSGNVLNQNKTVSYGQVYYEPEKIFAPTSDYTSEKDFLSTCYKQSSQQNNQSDQSSQNGQNNQQNGRSGQSGPSFLQEFRKITDKKQAEELLKNRFEQQ